MTPDNESEPTTAMVSSLNTSFNPSGSKPYYILSGGKDKGNLEISNLGEIYSFILSDEWGRGE